MRRILSRAETLAISVDALADAVGMQVFAVIAQRNLGYALLAQGRRTAASAAFAHGIERADIPTHYPGAVRPRPGSGER